MWFAIALLTLLVIAMEIVIGANYAGGTNTGDADGAPHDLSRIPHTADIGMVPERIMDTLSGAGIGMVFAVLCSTRDDRIHLARHHANRAKQRARTEG